MRLILVRHGQTDWNIQLRTQGHTDEPLNDTGKKQSALLGERLSKTEIHGIYSSPLSRAVDTARAIAKGRDLCVISEPLMMERDFGDWEGESFADLKQLYPDLMKLWRVNPYECNPPNAETIPSVIKRCEDFLSMLEAKHGSKDTIAVVGHSVPLRIMLLTLLCIPYKRMHSIMLGNASATVINVNPTILHILNDTSHLDSVI